MTATLGGSRPSGTRATISRAFTSRSKSAPSAGSRPPATTATTAAAAAQAAHVSCRYRRLIHTDERELPPGGRRVSLCPELHRDRRLARGLGHEDELVVVLVGERRRSGRPAEPAPGQRGLDERGRPLRHAHRRELVGALADEHE